ncbi:unnamed protein product [Prorocentrum cordatum]|uniref:Uncharacterized protein n=1 Tax=Prorocentrum cordatum TaxID=2364126 RepID=A0ABN9WGT4_9DINO|nr:unnamed protein product [Polarella glacialis]
MMVHGIKLQRRQDGPPKGGNACKHIGPRLTKNPRPSTQRSGNAPGARIFMPDGIDGRLRAAAQPRRRKPPWLTPQRLRGKPAHRPRCSWERPARACTGFA